MNFIKILLGTLMYKLLLLIKSSPLLYKNYLKLVGKFNPKLFPNQHTDLHIAGFQRSGNSFCKKLLERLLPDMNLATHVHAVATMKLAQKYEIPTIVLIRDPKNCISSSVVKSLAKGHSKIRAMKAVSEYVAYYQYVLNNKDKFTICDFEVIKSAPREFVRLVEVSLHNKIEQTSLEKAIDATILDIKSKKKLLDAKGIEGDFGWASPEKEIMKNKAFETIEQSPTYLKAESVHRELAEYANHKKYY